jgi:hypothetical protein
MTTMETKASVRGVRLSVDKALERDPADRYQTMRELTVGGRPACVQVRLCHVQKKL